MVSNEQTENTDMETNESYLAKPNGSLEDRYQIYLECADDGNGGDITRNGEPLKTFEKWLND